MKTKLKTCDGCNQEKPIWKSSGTGGLKLCKNCWSCHKSGDTEQKPTNSAIPRVSAKRAKKDAEYSKLRQRYLTENPLCVIKVNGCTNGATDVHHVFSGSDRDIYYLVQSTFLATCRSCHQWIHNNPEQARILGYLK
jgi:cytochrome c553